MDRGDWRATVHGVAKGWSQLKQLTQPVATLGPEKTHVQCNFESFFYNKMSFIFSQIIILDLRMPIF